MSTEQWKPVPVLGFGHLYEISSEGWIRRTGADHVLVVRPGPKGYAVFTFQHGPVKACRAVHTLVAAAFLPGRTDGSVITFKDGNKANARVDNLEWVSAEDRKEQIRSEKVQAVDLSADVPEEWRPVQDFPGYEVSNRGDIRRPATGKVISRIKVDGRYFAYNLSRDGKAYRVMAHRVVAAAFLPPHPEDGQDWQVSHKGGPTTSENNDARNLMWAPRASKAKQTNKGPHDPPANPGETWKPVAIDGWQDQFMVSDHGRVFNRKTGNLLTPSNTSNGYPAVHLVAPGRRCPIGMHRLVALTFLPPPEREDQWMVDHVNGDRQDFRLCNLRWVSDAENVRYGCETGKMVDYPEEVVERAKEMFNAGARLVDIAKETGMSPGYVSSVLRGKARVNRRVEAVEMREPSRVDLSAPMEEEWREAPGFPMYEVSNKGRVRRERRVLHTYRHQYGYAMCSLRRGGETHCVTVHRLVALAFLPAPPDDGTRWEVNHINGKDSCGCADVRNLEWVTHSMNLRHANGHKYTAHPRE
jgi:hypothetical protein